MGKPGPGAVRGAGGNPELLPWSVRDFRLRDPLQPERPYRSGRRYGASAVVPVHALYASCWKPRDVARQHRSRDLRTSRWNLDVPQQAVRAADECPVRDWLGHDSFCTTIGGLTSFVSWRSPLALL